MNDKIGHYAVWHNTEDGVDKADSNLIFPEGSEVRNWVSENKTLTEICESLKKVKREAHVLCVLLQNVNDLPLEVQAALEKCQSALVAYEKLK
jgi:hypothetical protein